MNPSVRLGRILGIPFGISWSWLLVFGLITWTLGSGIFPHENPGLSKATYYVMAVVASLLFFGALLLHELGHALAARREGMEIEGITRWLFGGLARFSTAFPSARAELRIDAGGARVRAADDRRGGRALHLSGRLRRDLVRRHRLVPVLGLDRRATAPRRQRRAARLASAQRDDARPRDARPRLAVGRSARHP